MAPPIGKGVFPLRPRRSYRFGVDFSDSTFAALNLPEEPFDWGRMLVLALVLTLAAASAGILAGGLLT